MRKHLILILMILLLSCSCSNLYNNSNKELGYNNLVNDANNDSDENANDSLENDVNDDFDDSDSDTVLFNRQTVTWGSWLDDIDRPVIKIDNENNILVINYGVVTKFNPDLSTVFSIVPAVPEDIISENAFGTIDATTGTVDKEGNIFFAGHIDISIEDGPDEDHTFITKYKQNEETAEWTELFQYEVRLISEKIVADSDGNLLLVGSLHKSNKLLVSKWSNDGVEIWKKTWGVDSVVTGIATDDSNNIYITGFTEGEFEGFTNSGETDIFLSKFSSDGSIQWTKQWGTDKRDKSSAVAVDKNGNIFVTGFVEKDYVVSENIFLVKFDGDGSEIWTQQIGSTIGSGSRAYSVVTDSEGSSYVTGGTKGKIDNSSEYTGAGNDIFIAKWAADSELMWIEHLGSDEDDEGFGIVLDATGNIFVTGYTEGSLDGNTAPDNDSTRFLTKLIPQ